MTGIISTASVWLVRKIVEQFLAQNLERYKIKFGKLHLDRAKIIKEIYYQFHDVKNSLYNFVAEIAWSYDNLNEKPKNKAYLDYDHKVTSLRKYIEKNDIYFSDNLVKEMLKVAVDLQSGPVTAHGAHETVVDKDGTSFRDEKYSEMVKLLSGKVLEPLKKEFQKIIDIDK